MGKQNASSHEELVKIFGAEIAAEAARMVRDGRKLNLKSDTAFKLFFSNDTPEANACLRSFLSAAIGRTVSEAVVTNAELRPEFFGAKRPRLDVNCTFDGGQRADIELQLTAAEDDQILRAVYYGCKLYAGALPGGAYYRDIPRVYQIFLLDFPLFTDRDFHHRGMFRLDNGAILADNPQLLFFEFPKLRGAPENLRKVKNWCRFIEGCGDLLVVRALAEDKSWQEDLKMAVSAYNQVSEEERAWAYHLSLDRAETDYRNGLRHAEQRGEERGEARGISLGMEQANIATAKRMLGKVSPEMIAEYTGLSLQQVSDLRRVK